MPRPSLKPFDLASLELSVLGACRAAVMLVPFASFNPLTVCLAVEGYNAYEWTGCQEKISRFLPIDETRKARKVHPKAKS